MTWAEGTRQVLVQVSRQALQEHLAGLRGGPSDRPLTSDGTMDLSAGLGAALRRLVMWLVAQVGAGNPPIGSGLMARQIESTVLSGLLEARHDHQGNWPASVWPRDFVICVLQRTTLKRI